MASGPLVGGGEKSRWATDGKVYTRKSFKKPSSAPQPPPAPPAPPPPASSTAPAPADDATSSQPPPPPVPSPSAASGEDAASSLNRHPEPVPVNNHNHNHDNMSRHHESNGQHQPPPQQQRTVTISLSSLPRHELRDLRRRLTAELEQVRALAKKIDALAPTPTPIPVPAAPPAAAYTASQLSVSDPNTPLPKKKPKSEAASLRRQLSISVAQENSLFDSSMEKEKRTPKANQYYRNSEFLLAKDKFPPADSHGHKKSKANGSKKHPWDADHATSLLAKKYAHAFKSCGSLLSRLMKHKYGWVFNTPVDVKGLGLHDYYSIISKPMDLGTVKSKLNKNWYKNPGEFAEDVRLTFRNAMTYNPKGQDVHFMAEQLFQMFEERWPAIEAEYTYVSYPTLYPSVTKKVAQPFDMRTLERSDSTVHPVAVQTKPKPVHHVGHIGRPPALKKPKAKDLFKREMTTDEKKRLGKNLQGLPDEKLQIVVQIINKRSSSINVHDGEIEVDIDSVDVETLWELDRFVTNYKKSLSKHKRKAELAMLARAEAARELEQRAQERISEPVIVGDPKGSRAVADEKEVASSSPVGREMNEENASRSSSSSSSGSDSGSSSSDSDSESSSGYESDAGHSPRT